MHKLILIINGLSKLLLGLCIIALLLFIPAGTWHYWHAWLFIALLFTPMLCIGTWLLITAPELLQKRLNNKESEQEQKHVIALSGVMFIVGFIVCGLDFRFGWSHMPIWVTIAATIVFCIGYILYIEVMRENAYLSRTIEIQEGQKLIDTGLYGIVRHPMYTASLLIFLTMPLVLDSIWGLAVFLFYPILIIVRIKNEEMILVKGLPGYSEYQQRIRYRLIPGVW